MKAYRSPFGWRTSACRIGALLLGGVVLLVGLSASLAQPKPRLTQTQRSEYLRLYKKGNMFLYQGQYTPAIAHFRSAIKIAPDLPGAWRQLGLAHEGREDHREAIKAYEKYLEVVGKGGKYKVKVMRRINVCRKKLGLPPKRFKDLFGGRPGKVVLKSNVEGASVRVDNVRRGSTPTPPLPVTPGLHTVTVSKQGYLPWSESITVESGQELTIEAELKKDPNYKPKVIVRPVARPKPATKAFVDLRANVGSYDVLVDGEPASRNEDGYYELEPGERTIEVKAEGRLPWSRKLDLVRGQRLVINVRLVSLARRRKYELWAWGTFGAAAGLAAAGLVFGLLENQTYEKVRDRDADNREALGDLREKGKVYRGVAIGLYSAAAAALITSVVFFVKKRRGESASGSPKRTISVGPMGRGGGIGVTYGGEVSF